MNLFQSYRRLRSRLQHRRWLRRHAQVSEQDYLDLLGRARRYSQTYVN
jgi:hypothetical protein